MQNWLTAAEIGTFVILIISLVYKRITNWNKIMQRVQAIEDRFVTLSQMFEAFMKKEDQCRHEVRTHMGNEAIHIGVARTALLEDILDRVTRIENHIMK